MTTFFTALAAEAELVEAMAISSDPWGWVGKGTGRSLSCASM